jgi:predicted nuclease of predicted toxin-antitoxin system
MQFKTDENIPTVITLELRSLGHDVSTCQDEGLSGSDDPTISSHAIAENRVLVTLDLDFSDIRTYPPGSHPGIVIIRTARQDAEACRTAIALALSIVDEQDFQGNIAIVEDARVRIRRS